MFPVCPLCCFIVISMDPVSEINDDDDDDDEIASPSNVSGGHLTHVCAINMQNNNNNTYHRTSPAN